MSYTCWCPLTDFWETLESVRPIGYEKIWLETHGKGTILVSLSLPIADLLETLISSLVAPTLF